MDRGRRTAGRRGLIAAVQRSQVTTAQELPGQPVLKNFGVVRGLTVRSRSIVGNFFAGIQSLFGGDISLYRELCEQARRDAFDQMCREADRLGAKGINIRYAYVGQAGVARKVNFYLAVDDVKAALAALR